VAGPEVRAPSDRWGTGRTEAFSDGVFAIAITLLVVEISVPERDFDNLWKGIADQWPSYLGYVTSFVTVGAVWLVRHAIFRRLASADVMVMRLNILLLMLVSFLPFPTKLVAETLDLTRSSERAAVIFYGVVLLSISAVTGALWRHVAGHRDLLEPDVTDDDVTAMTLLTTPNMGAYVVVVLLAILAPKVAALGYLAIAVVAVLRTRGDSTAASAPA
jgi:uncharacterized membrane protein